jgi:hypothetical protein
MLILRHNSLSSEDLFVIECVSVFKENEPKKLTDLPYKAHDQSSRSKI